MFWAMLLLLAGACLLALWWHGRARAVGEQGEVAPGEPSARGPSWLPHDALPVFSGAQLMERSQYATLLQSVLNKTGLSAENNQSDIVPVVQAYAEFVQLLPASEAHHHANPGGLLLHTLEVVDFALAYRRSYMLPLGAGAERVNELKHVWTSGVLLSALFHDVGKPMSDVLVQMYGPKLPRAGRRWQAMAGSMLDQGATHYTVNFNPERRYEDHQNLSLSLMQRLVPAHVVAWLAELDSELLRQLMDCLGPQTLLKNILVELVKRADQESTRSNLLNGPRTRFKSARETPLINVLDEGLNRLLAAGRLRFNVPGGHGFIWSGEEGQGDLLLVCPRIVDELRSFLKDALTAGSRGIPTDNLILYGAWLDYSRVRALPAVAKADGSQGAPRAVWRVQVEGIPTTLTVLRFPRDSATFSELEAKHWPGAFDGMIHVSDVQPVEAELPVASIDEMPPIRTNNKVRLQQTSAPIAVPEFLLEHAEDDSEPPKQRAPISTMALHVAQSAEVEAAKTAFSNGGGLQMDEELSQAQNHVATPEPPSLVARMLMSGVAPSTARSAQKRTGVPSMQIKSADTSKKPESVEQFEDWLRLGLQSGHLTYNGPQAMVHFFARPAQEGGVQGKTVALFVTPALYQRYVKELQPEKWGGVSTLADIPRIAWLPVQTGLLKANLHRKEQQGKINRSVFRFATKGGGVFTANVMMNPEAIFGVVPEPNPFIAGEVNEAALAQVAVRGG